MPIFTINMTVATYNQVKKNVQKRWRGRSKSKRSTTFARGNEATSRLWRFSQDPRGRFRLCTGKKSIVFLTIKKRLLLYFE